ncbi:hypothetical protein [Leptothermofonsia sp. ETS-13]|uniref:hypothetical protein n=1 Tax=Leptothermofonsia sp. ETS-13 TaxID=3035696 RepID=UPI003B9E07D0
MPAPVRVALNAEKDRTSSELRVASTVCQRTRDCAHMVRLNAQEWNAPALADIFEYCEHTVRAILRRWQTLRVGWAVGRTRTRRQTQVAGGRPGVFRAMLRAGTSDLQQPAVNESGFCLWSLVSYSYSQVGEQKRMEQTQIRFGRRISILGNVLDMGIGVRENRSTRTR